MTAPVDPINGTAVFASKGFALLTDHGKPLPMKVIFYDETRCAGDFIAKYVSGRVVLKFPVIAISLEILDEQDVNHVFLYMDDEAIQYPLAHSKDNKNHVYVLFPDTTVKRITKDG